MYPVERFPALLVPLDAVMAAADLPTPDPLTENCPCNTHLSPQELRSSLQASLEPQDL